MELDLKSLQVILQSSDYLSNTPQKDGIKKINAAFL